MLSKQEKQQLIENVIKCIENTTLPANKIAAYYGLKTDFVQKLVDEVRECPPQS